MTMMTCTASCLLFVLCLPVIVTEGFHAHHNNNLWNDRRSSTLHMGLYDTPLPPRPAPRSNSGNNDPQPEDNDDSVDDEFMNRNKIENNEPLPPQKGRVSPKYEEQDPKVAGIVRGLNVPWEDAALALEANEGNFNEAWMAVSNQKQKTIGENVTVPKASGIDWDKEFAVRSSITKSIRPPGKDGIKNPNRETAQERFKRGVKEYFTKSERTGAQDWLPQKNPTPDEDEPWYTG